MWKKSFKYWVLIFFCIITLTSCKNQDFKEIADYSIDIDKEYDSERGFGNDRFTIYSFSVNENKYIEGFDPIKDIDKNILSSLENIMQNEEPEIKNMSEIDDFISNLEREEYGKFMHVVEGGTYKLYLYNPKTKNGYLFVFVI